MSNRVENFYPRKTQGIVRREPETQQDERQTGLKLIEKQLPLIEQQIAHLEERVAFYSSVDSIPIDVTANPEVHQRIVLANQMTRENLNSELEYLQSELEVYNAEMSKRSR